MESTVWQCGGEGGQGTFTAWVRTNDIPPQLFVCYDEALSLPIILSGFLLESFLSNALFGYRVNAAHVVSPIFFSSV